MGFEKTEGKVRLKGWIIRTKKREVRLGLQKKRRLLGLASFNPITFGIVKI